VGNPVRLSEDLSEKADLNRETDFPKAIIFLTRDMLRPYL